MGRDGQIEGLEMAGDFSRIIVTGVGGPSWI